MVFLDIETQNDWSNGESFKIENLKISYTGVIDSEGKEHDFWEKDTPQLFEFLKTADMIVHYNGFSFDMPVIANYVGPEVLELPQIDLMVAMYKTIGFRPKLDDVATATLGQGKIGSGADAVKYWAAQDLDSLKKYCLQDVKVTMDVYNFGIKNGFVKYFDKNGFIRQVDIDWTLGQKLPAAVNTDAISMF
ncbi:MAG: hypothetical protein Fur003_0970 [Candidatus Dojkabacteria bacterium]